MQVLGLTDRHRMMCSRSQHFWLCHFCPNSEQLGGSYRIGKRTLLDLLNTENELFEARKDYLDAKYAEQYAKYRVMNATGQLLNALRVDVPVEWNQKVEY